LEKFNHQGKTLRTIFSCNEPEESTRIIYGTTISSFQTSIKIEEALIFSLQGDYLSNLLSTADTLTEFLICTTQSFLKWRNF